MSLKNMKDRITCLSLFSGCGGLDLGFASSGFEILAAIDNWLPAVKNHNKNGHLFGGAKALHRSLRLSDNEIDLDSLPKVDVVLGGPPCQGYSFAGKQRIDDPRNQLYLDFKSIVSHIKPKAFLMENVRGLERMALANIEKSFLDIGYYVTVQRVKAVDLGIPQRRERIIIVGTQAGQRKFSVPEIIMGGLFGSLEPPTVFDTIKDLPKPISARNQSELTGGFLDDHVYLPLSELEQRFIRHIPNGGCYSDAPREALPARLKKIYDDPLAYKTPRLFPKADPNRAAQTIPASTSPSIGGVIAPDLGYDENGAYIINCKKYVENGVYTAPEPSRRFTPREIARLQGFPDNYLFEGSGSTKTKMIGNAVPVKMAQVFAKEIKSQLFQ
jgi:DNA (cytosine-5)-methyltransferase 1